jgi:hypothetical protein
MAKLKLRLDLEGLKVDSFDTRPVQDGIRGTVKGHDSDIPDTSTFDLGNHTAGCPSLGCPSLACLPPPDPNDRYRLPEIDDEDYA